jgi:hypothetical protein
VPLQKCRYIGLEFPRHRALWNFNSSGIAIQEAHFMAPFSMGLIPFKRVEYFRLIRRLGSVQLWVCCKWAKKRKYN